MNAANVRNCLRRLAATVLLAGIPACAAWSPAQVAPSSLKGAPREVRITLYDGQRFPVSEPRMSPDSFFGTMVGVPYEPVAMPVSSIKSLDLPRKDTNTVVPFVTLVVAAALVVGTVMLAGRSGT